MINCRSYSEIEWGYRGLKETFDSTSITYALFYNIVCFCIFFYVPDFSVEGLYILGITWEWEGYCCSLCFDHYIWRGI